MDYVLLDLQKQIPDIDLINDLRIVANHLGKSSLKMRDYCKENGAKFNYQTAKKRFGSWENVLLKAGLETEKSIHGIEYGESALRVELLIDDLIRVSKELENHAFTISEYDSHGKFGSATIIKRFSGWNKAKIFANLEVGRNYNTSVDEYMQNILNLWTHYGRQPKYAEVVKPLSKFNISSYENKFGTWRKALEAFVSYINEEQVDSNKEREDALLVELHNEQRFAPQTKKVVNTKRTQRTINLRIRWKIMKRDNFSCVKCGKSPAKEPNVELHVDHIIPWSKGGETVYENLETLCSDCNLGKSNII